MGSIFKYDDSYFTGHINFAWPPSQIYEYEKLPSLTVSGQIYENVWTNYLLINGVDNIQNGDLVCYFAKNVGLVKMVNFHSGGTFESNLKDYYIQK